MEKGILPRMFGPSVTKSLSGSERNIGDVVDRVFARLPMGVVNSAIGDSFYGLNHRQQPGAVSINKDYYGLTFFTRPRLNLRSENIRAVRQLTPLLTNEPASIQRIIRCLLDPTLANDGVSSPFVDRQQAFIPILTNHLLSMNGWPDLIAPHMTSEEGNYKEAFSFVDGVVQNYSAWSITANFRNLPGDPITAMMMVWLWYASCVYEGTMVPYPDAIIQNEIDYNTRIYRVVLDNQKRRVQGIAACGAAFPVSAPMGAKFNFEADRPLNQSNDQVSIQFQCLGAMYQDDILIDEFNRTVALFNDQMDLRHFTPQYERNDVTGDYTLVWQHQSYVHVPMDALGIFNNRGYPRIDPATYELQWWVTPEDYRQRLGVYQEFKRITDPAQS